MVGDDDATRIERVARTCRCGVERGASSLLLSYRTNSSFAPSAREWIIRRLSRDDVCEVGRHPRHRPQGGSVGSRSMLNGVGEEWRVAVRRARSPAREVLRRGQDLLYMLCSILHQKAKITRSKTNSPLTWTSRVVSGCAAFLSTPPMEDPIGSSRSLGSRHDSTTSQRNILFVRRPVARNSL